MPSVAPSPALTAKDAGAPPALLNLDEVLESHATSYVDQTKIAPLSAAPLSFGYGGLLRDGAGEGDFNEAETAAFDLPDLPDEVTEGGLTLKNKYIVRVGWDDVRGWLGEGGTLIGSSRCPSCEWGGGDD